MTSETRHAYSRRPRGFEGLLGFSKRTKAEDLSVAEIRLSSTRRGRPQGRDCLGGLAGTPSRTAFGRC